MGVPAGGTGDGATVGGLYCSRGQVKGQLSILSTDYDDIIDQKMSSACRAIDSHTRRMFWQTDPEPHTFMATSYWELDLHDDIGSTADMVVATDMDGDGVFETTWSSSDWQLLPFNAPYASPEAEPWTKIRAVRTRTFPLTMYNLVSRLNRVQITARWGWPAVPADVTEAAIILTGRLFHRRNSPAGIASVDEFGPVRISRSEDGDVVRLLDNYVRADSVMLA